MNPWRSALLLLALLLSACRGAGPQPTATPHLSATPSTAEGPGGYRPECFPEDEWVACQDDRLGLALHYPASWGFLVEAQLSEGTCGGQALVYRFDPWYTGPLNGGASPDYCQPGADPIQRFSGFPGETGTGTDLLDRCQQVLPQAVFCQAVNNRVWLAGLFPDAQAICQSAAGPAPEPRLAVAIDLPEGRPVSGLVLAQVFLSPAEAAGLYAPLGGNPPNRSLCRQAQALDAYQENASDLAHKIVEGQVDEVTMERLGAIRQLADSVQLDP